MKKETLALIKKLEPLKAPENWGELTGPYFHIHVQGFQPIGPFSAPILKDFVDEHDFPEDTKVQDAKSIEKWMNLYEHPFFQRRSPQIVGDQEIPPEVRMFSFLQEGRRHGPFPVQKLEIMLTQRELLLTDQVSFDDGHTWKKLYQFEEFNRRDFKNTNLPESPGWDIFKMSNSEVAEHLKNKGIQSSEADAIAGLAFIESIKSGKTSQFYDKKAKTIEEQNEQLSIEQEKTKKEVKKQKNLPENGANEESFFTKQYSIVASAILLVGAALFLGLGTSQQNERSPASNVSKSKADPAKPANKDKYKRGNYKTANQHAKAKKKLRSRKPASVTESDSFDQIREQRQMQDRAYQDEYPEDDYPEDNYDYGETPVEQDPVRSKLDKQTIDPEENYYDEREQDFYRDGYNAEEGQAEEIEPADAWEARGAQTQDNADSFGRVPADNAEFQYEGENESYQDEAIYEEEMINEESMDEGYGDY